MTLEELTQALQDIEDEHGEFLDVEDRRGVLIDADQVRVKTVGERGKRRTVLVIG